MSYRETKTKTRRVREKQENQKLRAKSWARYFFDDLIGKRPGTKGVLGDARYEVIEAHIPGGRRLHVILPAKYGGGKFTVWVYEREGKKYADAIIR